MSITTHHYTKDSTIFQGHTLGDNTIRIIQLKDKSRKGHIEVATI